MPRPRHGWHQEPRRPRIWCRPCGPASLRTRSGRPAVRRQRLLRQAGVPVLPGEKLREVPADDFVRSVAFHTFGAGIPACDDALGREHVQGVVGNALDQELKARCIAGVAAGGRWNSRSDGFFGHGPQHWRRRLSALSSNSDRSEASPTAPAAKDMRAGGRTYVRSGASAVRATSRRQRSAAC